MSSLFGWSLVAFVVLAGLYGVQVATGSSEACGTAFWTDWRPGYLRAADVFRCMR